MTRPFVCPAGRASPRRSPATSSVGVAAEVKQKLNLVDLIGESVQLRKAGASFKGLCPFHGEKTPSFTVTPSRETWKCFGCGRGGDIFNFVMERDSIDFPEALRRLAGRAGVEISERTSREDARRKRLRDALDSAIAFYHRILTESHHGQPALDYLRGRGFKDATISAHLLGYSVDSWDTLSKALIEKRDFNVDELEAAGLVSRRQGRRGVYDRFRGRIIFPIRDASGNATGLGGRIVGGEQKDANGRDRGPKYLNSPATLLFDKSRTLYLIDRAKGAIRKEGMAVLVEGNTDALMAHQQGFENVVGTLGTALTPAQIELVTRYASRIALAYDVDAAGQGAATFGATELSALVGEIERSAHKGRLTDVGVIRLPDKRDPDEVMRDDPALWRQATNEPQPIVEYLIDHFAKRHDPRTLSGRDKLVAAVMPTIRRVTNPTQRDGYLQQLARRSGVEERVLLEELRRPEQAAKVVGRPAEAHVGSKINLEAVLSSPDALDPQAVASLLKRAEFSMLRLLLMRPYLREAVDAPTDIEFASTPAREIWTRLQDTPAAGFDRAAFAESLDPILAGIVRTMYADPEPLPEDEDALRQALDQSLMTLRRNRLDEEIGAKEFDIREAEADGDRPAAERLLRDVIDLKARRLALDRHRQTNTVLTQRRQRATAASAAASGGNG
ncbi:MAG: DNA primase [Candidatus Limnocylindrales bacterium]